MNSYLNNAQKYRASNTLNDTFVAKIGIITSFDPNKWQVSVNFARDGEGLDAPGAVQVPLGSPWVGSNYGAYFAPETGVSVLVVFADADLQSPVCACLLNDINHFPPTKLSAGEALLQHKSGSVIKMTNDGNVSVIANNDLSVTAKNNAKVQADSATVQADKAVNVDAGQSITLKATVSILLDAPIVTATQNMTVTESLSANNGLTTMENGNFIATSLTAQSVSASGVSLAAHTHGGVQTGGGQTSPPLK